MELAIKKILNGKDIDNIESFSNPECLKEYIKIKKSMKDLDLM